MDKDVRNISRFRIAASWGSRARGLLGRKETWLGPGGVLILAPCSSVHTFGMRRPIDIAFADAQGHVLKSCERVGPGRVVACADAAMTLERFSPLETREMAHEGSTPCGREWPSRGERLHICS